MIKPDMTLVTVCSRCLRASCWYGEFMCDGARDASTKKVPRSVLAEKRLESPHHWTDDAISNGGTAQPR